MSGHVSDGDRTMMLLANHPLISYHTVLCVTASKAMAAAALKAALPGTAAGTGVPLSARQEKAAAAALVLGAGEVQTLPGASVHSPLVRIPVSRS